MEEQVNWYEVDTDEEMDEENWYMPDNDEEETQENDENYDQIDILYQNAYWLTYEDIEYDLMEMQQEEMEMISENEE